MRLYLDLMFEARNRLDAISTIHLNQAKLGPGIVRELCYLQLRILCELIAMSCLVAHGDSPRTLREIYQADKIVNAMSKLREHFYPLPATRVTRDNHTLIKGLPDANHLAKADLVKLWGISGDVLHRSPLSKLEKRDASDVADCSDVLSWQAKVCGLLNEHLIALGGRRGLLVSLSVEGTNKPQASIFDVDPDAGTMKVRTFTAV